jgi:hypothetical protein
MIAYLVFSLQVTKYLQHKEWETRVAAGLTVEYLAGTVSSYNLLQSENVPVWNPAAETDPSLEQAGTTLLFSF